MHPSTNFAIAAVCLLSQLFVIIAANPVVRTSNGLVQGTTMTSREGKKIRAFRSIPYAKPPVGDLRFKAPVPADPWPEVLNATQDPPNCVQKNYFLPNPEVEGQEDCLYLNVYTPEVNPKHSASLPVMIYLHGGGWFTGSSSSVLYGPEYLLDAGVLLVTLNYRLGALGFLSTGTDEAPGNWAFKDQLLAMRWVKENIANFGGDPDNITLFGQSAGAGAAHLHAITPGSKGLFNRIICMSGVSLGPWATPFEDPLERARKHAFYLGATSRQIADWTPAELVEFMRQQDAKDITETDTNFRVWAVDPLTTYRPVVEYKTAGNPEPFMTDTPLELTRAAGANVVPMLMGVAAHEGIVRAGDIYTNDTLRTDFNKRIDTLGPFILELRQDESTWEDIRNYYFGEDGVVDEENLQNFIDLISDRAFLHSTAKAIRMHSYAGPSVDLPPIYLYNFNYEGLYSFAPIYAHSPAITGATHSDDTVYVFRMPGIFPDWPEDHPDVVMSKLMVNIFTNFAKYGDPTPSNIDISWTPALSKDNVNSIRKQRLTYLDLAKHKGDEGLIDLRIVSGFYMNRLRFWDSLPLLENKYGV